MSATSIAAVRNRLFLIGILALAAPAAAQCTLSFAAPVNYGTGVNPYSTAVADFDADGKPDLAVVNNGSSSSVSIFLGNIDGTFRAAGDFGVRVNPTSVAVGHFDAGATVDLAVANGVTNTVSILLGNGNGSFQTQVEYAVGSVPQSIAVSDFNADGSSDLAVGNAGTNTVSILLGNGNGTFQSQVTHIVGMNPNGVAVGDFDGDGTPDLAVASDNVEIMLGNGTTTNTFQPAVTYFAGLRPAKVVVGNFNGDPNPDLAVTNFSDDTVSILLGNGTPANTFQTPVNFAVGDGPQGVAVGDFSGDGRADLAVTNELDDTASILLGNGNGTFQPRVNLVLGDRPFFVTIGDFNADTRPDLAIPINLALTVSVILNNGSFGAGPTITQHPVSQTTCPRSPVSFSVTATGTVFQWRKNAAAIPGATSATFTIASASGSDAGNYDCVVTNGCGSVTSDAATLTICVADTDDGSGTGMCDGGVTIDDLLYYLGIFEEGLVAADVDDGSGGGTPDGGVTIDDLLYYLFRFEAGC